MSKNEILLYGTVGGSFWDDDEHFTASSVAEQLAAMSGPVTIRLNSGGGIASEGQAIYTMLVDYPDTVDMVIEGVAASAASLIAMAGDTITMRLGSYMLIHDPAQDWIDERGTEEAHLKAAEALRVLADGYADIYAKRSGLTQAEVREIMKAETYLGPGDAVAKGFATHTDTAAAAAMARFDYRIYHHAPAALLAASQSMGHKPAKTAILAMMAGMSRTGKGTTMADKATGKKAGDAAVDDATQAEIDAAAAPAAETKAEADAALAVEAAMTAKAVAAERARANRITDMVQMAHQPVTMATKMIAEGITIDAAHDIIMKKWKEAGDMDQKMNGREPARVGMEAREKFATGATAALMMKVGLKGERNEFSSLSLAELARESITMGGAAGRFNDKREMVGRAFTMSGMHTTSDFGNILSNVMGKAALQGWEEAEETYQLWTRSGVLTDYKATKRVGAGLFGALPQVREGADYTYGTVSDRGETIALGRYGQLLRISREAIINDDLSILGNLPRKMGRAARATIGDLVYAVLTSNPAMSDGVNLFHATHANLAAAGAAPSITSMSAGRTAMRTQKEAGRTLNITPKYMIVPAALEMTAAQLLNSAVDPSANKGHAANPVAGMAELITDGRLDAASATAWYLAGDARAFDTIEVAYLDGNEAPYLEEQTAWTSDGVEIKVRIEAGVAPLDFRTLYKNPGA